MSAFQTQMSTDTADFRSLGFLGKFPGREYKLQEAQTGAVAFQAVGLRLQGDDFVKAANASGLKLAARFDAAHPDFALIETTGERSAIVGFAQRLDAQGYHRLGADEIEPWELEQKEFDPSVPPPVSLDELPDPMTDADVARFLRRQDPGHSQRLRLNGLLAFRPGRPPLISKAALMDYVERATVTAKPTPRKPLASDRRRAEKEEAMQDLRAWAVKMLQKPKGAPRGKSKRPPTS
jgi:hypothetical protein